MDPKMQASVSVDIQPTVHRSPDGEGYIISAVVQLTNRGGRNTRITWRGEPAPFSVRSVKFGDDGKEILGPPMELRVRLTADPNFEAVSHLIRAGGTETIPFTFRVSDPALYRLSFRAAVDAQERAVAKELGATLPTAWTCTKYVLVEGTSIRTRSTAVETHVVVLVHGIRDYAIWQNSIRSTLEGAGFKVEPTNYDRFNLIKFLVPIWFFRRQAIEDVWKQFRIIVQNNPNAPISVIAHSFGTFVVSHLMKEGFDLKFHRVIFCGSVVPYDFSYEQIQNRFDPPIINEVGTRDIWPAMAESLTSGYGSAGTYGFRRPLVRDRWHNGAGHGYFLDPSFCKKYWVPFLRDKTIVSGSENPERPRGWLQVLSILQVKYIVLLVLLALILAYAGPNFWSN